MKLFIGVDPGLGGGVAFYWPDDPTTAVVYDMPLERGKKVHAMGIKELMLNHHLIPFGIDVHGAVELVGSRPRQQGAFNFGFSTGIVHGVLGCFAIPILEVSPNKWKPSLGLQRPPTETISENKDRARATASKLFPHLASQLTRKKDDGRAEALLIAFYAAHRKENKP